MFILAAMFLNASYSNYVPSVCGAHGSVAAGFRFGRNVSLAFVRKNHRVLGKAKGDVQKQKKQKTDLGNAKCGKRKNAIPNFELFLRSIFLTPRGPF